MIITFNPGMRITNTQHLPRGTGARFLEVMEPHEPGLPLIAVAWRRSKPAKLPTNHHLVEFVKS
jgi:hypothetical protein